MQSKDTKMIQNLLPDAELHNIIRLQLNSHFNFILFAVGVVFIIFHEQLWNITTASLPLFIFT